MAAGIKDGWWEFDGTSAYLSMPGHRAHRFDPQKNSNDFTVAGVIRPTTITGFHPIFSKFGSASGDYSYMLRQNGSSVQMYISDDGTLDSGHWNVATVNTALTAGVDSFYCARYDYVTDGTSDFRMRVDDLAESIISNANGPIFSDSGVDLEIGMNSTSYFGGRMYWIAYWNRKLTDDEVDALEDGTVLPWQLQPDMYIDFHQAVGSTYISEWPVASNEWEFDVSGTPTAAGSDVPTLPDSIGVVDSRMHPRDVYAANMNTPESSWWNFAGGSSDYLRLNDGGAPEAEIFDPASNNDDFSIMGVFECSDAGGEDYEGLFGKHDSVSGNYRSWFANLEYRNAKFAVSKNGQGGIGNASILTHPNIVQNNTKHFFAGRYKYVTDGTSTLKWRIDDTEITDSAAVGPVFSSTTPPVMIANILSSHPTFCLKGKMYWVAYWNRTLEDWEVEGLRRGTVHPEATDPDYYEDFHDAVAGTNPSEIPGGVSAIDFTVYGTPTRSGTGVLSVPRRTLIESGYSNPMTAGMLTLDPQATAAQRGCVELCRPIRDREFYEGMAGPADGWWDFDATTPDYLLLSSGSPYVSDFNPGGDFSIVARVRVDDWTATRAIASKWSILVGNRVWLLRTIGTNYVNVAITAGVLTPLQYVANVQTDGTAECLIAIRYDQTAHKLYANAVNANQAVEGENDTTGTLKSYLGEVRIGSFSTENHDGRIYWLAYYKHLLRPLDLQQLFDGTQHPQHLGPTCYIDFHQDVDLSYTADVGDNPYSFGVAGTPTHEGSSESSVLGTKPSELGIVTPTSVHLVPNIAATAQHRGLVSILNHQRNRGK